jgi:hypothetical protein
MNVREVAGKRAWLIVAVAMAAILPARSATRSLEPLVQAVIRNGIEGMLPAHLSVVLGVVILTCDELSHSTKVYLTSGTGKLRKAIYYQPGAAANERSLADAGSDFASEITFWASYVQKPAPLK